MSSGDIPLGAPLYEGVDLTQQYLNYADGGLGIDGILRVLKGSAGDHVVSHINFSRNITSEEMSRPPRSRAFLSGLKEILKKHKSLTAIDLADNHLFDNFNHPTNEHLTNYIEDFTDIFLRFSSITHVDFSGNCMVGPYPHRQFKGLATLMRKFYLTKGLALVARRNFMNSQAILTVASGLGVSSTLTYLDLSDNIGGLDPTGKHNSEGIYTLSVVLSQTPNLKVLKLARNHMNDDDIEMICNAVSNAPQFQVLDLSGNNVMVIGARAIRDCVVSHSLFIGPGIGLRELSIGGNPLGAVGMVPILEAVRRTETIERLDLSNCNMDEETMLKLKAALCDNCTIVEVDVSKNPVNNSIEIKTKAEAVAMKICRDIIADPLGVDCRKFPRVVYNSLAKKLRYLPKAVLEKLHYNPSFNEDESVMRLELHMVEPPPRTNMVGKVKVAAKGSIDARLEQSRINDKNLNAAKKVYKIVISWYRVVKYRNGIKKSLEAAKLRDEATNKHNDEDDRFKY